MSLTEFLQARVEEDKAAARAATGEHWEVAGPYSGTADVVSDDGSITSAYDEPCCAIEDAQHIARWDPARVLAECEAKEQVVRRCASVLAAFDDPVSGEWPDVSRREKHHAYETLCAFAAVYAAHADYRPEWRPGA